MKPLDQCRVLDLGIITAGAATSAVLADLGANVVKIESDTYRDPFRQWEGEVLEGESADLPPFFRMTNRGKANLALDLKTPKGREVFLSLVRNCDVVVENFRRGVLDRLGLSYDTLREANPDIILASISSQGEYGPDSAYVSFGSTLEAMSGLSAITGYPDGPPVVSGNELNYPDQVVAIFASSMIATAWYACQRGQGGAHLDLSQRELTSFLSGDAFFEPLPRHGNAQRDIAVQDCFQSADDEWIAVTASDDAMVETLTGGASHSDMANWINARSAAAAISGLVEAGIPAARVLDGVSVLSQRNKAWTRAIETDPNGQYVKGTLFGDGSRAPSLDRPAVHLGCNTRDVLARLAGYGSAQIDELLRLGVVSEPETEERPSIASAR